MQFGFDPEFFITNKTGRAVPAHRFFDEKAPQSNLLYFRDGAAVEMNAIPSTCAAGSINSLFDVIKQARAHLRSKYPEGKLVATSAMLFPLELWEGAPQDVMEVGCHPSWNAYTVKEKGTEMDLYNHPFRYGGGHMHFSSFRNVKDFNTAVKFIKLLDWKIGVLDAFFFGGRNSARRRLFYGRAGDFRFHKAVTGHSGYTYKLGARWNADYDPSLYKASSPLRVEYRTPGPEMWLHPNVFVSLYCAIARECDNQLDPLTERLEKIDPERIKTAINTGEGAEALLSGLKYDGFGVYLRGKTTHSQAAGSLTDVSMYTVAVIKALKEKMKRGNLVLRAKIVEAHIGFTDYLIKFGLAETMPGFKGPRL